ncbi:MAG: tRNA (adenosine(37)-N6)-threonylcarbamoyltransferase complex transferase subunit TsaD [Bacteroidia bacterium]|nr:tRNA (adenosine(37)-N6)-threonylcarbamoyltransferase complex transferase subunit TsaD [Bacteroidia bacterium]
MSKIITILGIESSCDDTSAAIIQDGKMLANVIANQKVHELYGGVVPELASRAHQLNIIPVIDQALKRANISKKQIDAVAFTRGPGLLGSLLVGTSFAKSFSLALNIPLIEVNHMQGHILAHFIDDPENMGKPNFPFLCLTVSGGHTQIVRVNDFFDMEILGETIDDAAGEAFDKVAKVLGLPYPGGPLVDKYAKEGNAKAFKFSRPQVADFDFSFSGLKTNVMNFINQETQKNEHFITENLKNICASIQYTIIDILISKLLKASDETGITEIAIAGGVSANSELRKRLLEFKEQKNWNVYIPKFEYCTDNAAMIAITGYYKYLKNDFTNQSIAPKARYSI